MMRGNQRRRRRAGDSPQRGRTGSTRSSSPRPRARRTTAGRLRSRSAPSTRTPSRCAACSRSTTREVRARPFAGQRPEPGGTTIVFRGVASSGLQFGAVSSSALYLDEQPITQSGRSPDPRFIDIERHRSVARAAGHAVRRELAVGHAARHHQQARPARLRCLGRGAGLARTRAGGEPRRERHGQPAARRPRRTAPGRLHAPRTPGYIDNVLGGQPGRHVRQLGRRRGRRQQRRRRAAARAALRFDVERQRRRRRFGALYPGADARRPRRHVGRRLGDLEQVRFEEESLDDEWYQVSLTLNAELPFADAVRRRLPTSTATSATRRTPPTTSSRSTRTRPTTRPPTISAATRAASPRTTRTREITTVEARLQSNADSESRWSWLGGVVLQPGSGHTPRSTATSAATRTRRRSITSAT